MVRVPLGDFLQTELPVVVAVRLREEHVGFLRGHVGAQSKGQEAPPLLAAQLPVAVPVLRRKVRLQLRVPVAIQTIALPNRANRKGRDRGGGMLYLSEQHEIRHPDELVQE